MCRKEAFEEYRKSIEDLNWITKQVIYHKTIMQLFPSDQRRDFPIKQDDEKSSIKNVRSQKDAMETIQNLSGN